LTLGFDVGRGVTGGVKKQKREFFLRLTFTPPVVVSKTD